MNGLDRRSRGRNWPQAAARHIRVYACQKFLDSSKLKRHQVVHTGVKEFVCQYDGCGKAFNLDFNLRAHMRTHSQEHYHVCPYSECGKRYTQECKLKTHIKSQHEKNNAVDTVKRAPPTDKFPTAIKTPSVPTAIKAPAVANGSGSSARPFVCYFEGCGKDYIHSYKLVLHLKSAHHVENPEETIRRVPAGDHATEGGYQDTYIAKGGVGKNSKRSKPSLVHEMPPAKVAYRRVSSPANVNPVKKPWPVQETYEEEDSEETEEELDTVGDDRWRFHVANGDDEETEDED